MKVKNKLSDINGFGIVLSSFNSKELYFINELIEIDKKDFKLHYSNKFINPTSKSDYASNFNKVIEQINNGQFQKVVLSRTKNVSWNGEAINLFEKLNAAYQATFNYILSSEDLGLWMGASPELLCSINDDKLSTNSIAGTKLKNEEWGEKEMEEQHYVTNYIVNELSNLALTNIKTNGPMDMKAGPVLHLKTIITASIGISNWYTIVARLHPTPATCGIPTIDVMSFIENIEIHARKLYTGYVGILKDEKQFFVNLRCMQLSEATAHLYLGGGITNLSEMEKEWLETERKAKTLESILESD